MDKCRILGCLLVSRPTKPTGAAGVTSPGRSRSSRTRANRFREHDRQAVASREARGHRLPGRRATCRLRDPSVYSVVEHAIDMLWLARRRYRVELGAAGVA
jgi:hypothetical protein